MASHHDHVFDSTKAALVLLYGNTNKKHRYLDRDVLLVGRARGCDFGLEAPDISSIHCLITRQSGGFTLRDCQSRSGTKVNGNQVREATLRDGDLLQLGPFSFRVHLPAGCLPPATATGSRLMHLERSRRNLARLALRQRKLARIDTSESVSESRLLVEEQLSKKASALRMRVKDYEQRLRVLEDAERELSRDREAIERDQAAFREKMKLAEAELAERRKQAQAEMAEAQHDASAVDLGAGRDLSADERRHFDEQRQQLAAQAEEIEKQRLVLEYEQEQSRQREKQLAEATAQHQLKEREAQAIAQRLDKREQKVQVLEQSLQPRLKEHQNRCRELDAQQREAASAAKQAKQRADETKAWAQQLALQQQRLQDEARQRQHELEDRTRSVEVREQQVQAQWGSIENLTVQQQQFAAKVLEFEQQQKEFFKMRDQGAQASPILLERLAQQKMALARAEEMLREQRQCLDDVLAGLQENQLLAAPGEHAELQELRAENERLRLDATRQTAGQDERIAKLQSENEELQRMLLAMEEERQLPPAEAHGSSDEVLRLRKLLAEQEAELRQLDQVNEDALGHTEARATEAQFSEYRRQLESDRQKLHVEIEQMRIRNQELDEATREMELEMSRERADLARERQRLERLREDVRLETERLHREAGMRERLAPVQSLREELSGKRQSGSDQTPKPGKDDATPQRLRGLRN